MLKSWRALTLWKRVFIGLALGVLVGLGLHYGLGAEKGADIAEAWFQPFGQAFVNLIKMLVVPLIATTLVSGVVAMGDPKRLGSLGIRTIGMYLMTTFFAVWLGLLVGTIFQPGAGMGEVVMGAQASVDTVTDKLSAAGSAKKGFADYLVGIIPTNPISALANGDVLGIIVFSIFVGVGILLVGEKAKPVADFFDAASEVVMKITMLIMDLAPYGVLALMAWVMGVNGLGILASMGKLAVALYLACILQIILIYGGLIIRVILKLPFGRFIYGIADAIGVAYSTASSNATLPVTISCAEHNLGVDKSVAGSVLPMGATINMDGTAIYLGIVALFAAQALGIDMTAGQYVMVALTATLTSIGAAGIPSAGLLLAASVLSVIGVTDVQSTLIIAFIFPFDRLLDMMRTVTNVSGDVAVACTVAKFEGELDEEVFRAKPVH
ncbi:MAG: dicarboxylate/amino acid:cation symporter [Acidimicrobiales bacterium]|nr:dicarboxylate/amino acid:cation symporter [Hyphomonadaceae bacterium]RZV45025.1 MAG: dicarboxylate/amino acid:cation symporter [Acidimicrobiales bacterium]